MMIDTSLDSSNFYFLLAVFQGVVLAGLVLVIKPFRKAHLYLSLLILVFSLSLLHLILAQSIHAFNAKYPIPMDFSLAYGPLVYLHVVAIKNPRRKLGMYGLLHFLPTLLIDGVLFSIFFIYAGSNITWAYTHLETIQTVALVITLLSLIQLCVYTILTFKQLREDRAALKEFSKIRNWLNSLLFSWFVIIVFLAIAITALLLNKRQLDESEFMLYNPLGIIIGLCIYGLGYLYLLKYRKTVDTYIDRVERFKFSEQELGDKKQRLLEALEAQRLYEDPVMNVNKLAQKLGWPVNDLSFLINEAFHTNFSDWINNYRVTVFKESLKNPKNKKYSMLGLSQEVALVRKHRFTELLKKQQGSLQVSM